MCNLPSSLRSGVTVELIWSDGTESIERILQIRHHHEHVDGDPLLSCKLSGSVRQRETSAMHSAAAVRILVGRTLQSRRRFYSSSTYPQHQPTSCLPPFSSPCVFVTHGWTDLEAKGSRSEGGCELSTSSSKQALIKIPVYLPFHLFATLRVHSQSNKSKP